MYRLLVETLLGIHLEGSELRLDPRMPGHWDSYKIHYRYRQTVYHITISRFTDATPKDIRFTLDGVAVPGATLPLVNDQREHHVDLKVPVAATTPPVSTRKGSSAHRTIGAR
jgi:cellobiose phosphorylase